MRIVAILWRSTHPGPTVVVTVIACALGVATGLGPVRLVALTAAVLAGQMSIGLSNDVLDAARDRAVGRSDKPLARPDAPVRTAWTAAVVAALVALAVSAALGWWLALAHAVFLGCGWAYNARLKSTIWSAACFLVGFGVFPSLAPLALPVPHVAPGWAWATGAALGVAIHFSNALPDLDDDARTGVRGLPHRLGVRGSAVVAFVALLAGTAAAVVGPLAAGATGVAPITATAGVAVTAVAAWGLVASLRARPGRLVFRLVMLAALILAAQLVVTR
nr:UbiA family prenyltransferase [Microbacterium bovistercoris]